MAEKLTHVDQTGKVRMVDIGNKTPVLRRAVAQGSIILNQQARTLIAEAMIKKGDVLTTAEIAGIQAAKKTSELIPLCHTILTDKVKVVAGLTDTGVDVVAEVRCHGKTGAEMEALTAVSIALLTVYDMVKAVDKQMIISSIRLTGKEKSS